MGEGHPEQAFQELVQLHKEFPNQPQLLRQLVEMAWDLGKIEESQRWEEELREREGPDGFYWRYYRARRLSAAIRDVKDKRFHEVEKLVDELLTLRPSWPRTHLLRAQIEQKRGNREQAIDAYSNAIRLGERRIEVYEQLTKLLYAERRFAEAEEYLGQLQEQVPLSENLSDLGDFPGGAGGTPRSRPGGGPPRREKPPQGSHGANLAGASAAGRTGRPKKRNKRFGRRCKWPPPTFARTTPCSPSISAPANWNLPQKPSKNSIRTSKCRRRSGPSSSPKDTN